MFSAKKYISEDIVSWLVILIAVPVMLVGFFRYNSMTFEVFAKEWIDYNFGIQKRSMNMNLFLWN